MEQYHHPAILGCKQCVEQHASCTGGKPECLRCKHLFLTCEYPAPKSSQIHASESHMNQHLPFRDALSSQRGEAFSHPVNSYSGLHSVPNSPRFSEYSTGPGQFNLTTSFNAAQGYSLPPIHSCVSRLVASNSLESPLAHTASQLTNQNGQAINGYSHYSSRGSWQVSNTESRFLPPTGLSFYAPSSSRIQYQSWAQNQSLVEQREHPAKLAEGAGHMGSKHWPFKSQQSSPSSTNSQSGQYPKAGYHTSHISESQKNPSPTYLSESFRPGATSFKEAIPYQPQVQIGIRSAGHSKGTGTTNVFHSNFQSRQVHEMVSFYNKQPASSLPQPSISSGASNLSYALTNFPKFSKVDSVDRTSCLPTRDKLFTLTPPPLYPYPRRSLIHSSISNQLSDAAVSSKRFRSPSPDPQDQPDSSRARPNGRSYQLPSSGSSKKSNGNSSQSSPSQGSMNDSHLKTSKVNNFLTHVLNSDYQPFPKKSKVVHESNLPNCDLSSTYSATQVSHTTLLPPKKACQACDCCYKAKTKCSRGLPHCIQCVKKKIKCSYTRTGLKKSVRPRPIIQRRIQAHILVFCSLTASYNKASTRSLKTSLVSTLQVGESIMDFSKHPPSPQGFLSKIQP